MSDTLKTISPVDGSVYVERPLHTLHDIDRGLDTACRVQPHWAALSLASRCQILSRAVDAFVAKSQDIATEITWQMGRPLRDAPGEVRGFEERSRHMLAIAAQALAAIQPGEKAGFQRQIKRVPLGVVVVVAPWNYPYLTAVNAVLPALIAGNAVVLKHSHQTPLCAERFLEAFVGAGVPAGVFQYLHLSHADTARLMGDRRVAGVCFTGSVSGGRAVVAATAAGFATSGLELGGKDPAYVRADANLGHAIETLSLLQRRPILLRHQKDLRGRIALRGIRRRGRRPDEEVPPRITARSANHDRTRGAHFRGGRGALASTGGCRARCAPADR